MANEVYGGIMSNMIKLEPLTCGYTSCMYSCWSHPALLDHVKREHYPIATANEQKFVNNSKMCGLQNAYPFTPSKDVRDNE